MSAVAVLDGGQSGTRIVIRGADGRERRVEAAPIRTDHPVVPQVATALHDAIVGSGVAVRRVAAGVSGLTDPEADAEALLALLRTAGVGEAALAHDSVTAYLAANGTAQGAVVAAGTGVVTLGVGERIARVDGWGYLLGDAGSAFWIGRAGLDAALRAFDGRAHPTLLLDALRARFGEPADVYMTLQADERRVEHVAAFAREVAQAAEQGDAAAGEVLDRAGRELGDAVLAALAAAAAPVAARVGWQGSVLARNGRIRAAMAAHVVAGWPGAIMTAPAGGPLDGVAALLDLPADHPLGAAVRRASGVRAQPALR